MKARLLPLYFKTARNEEFDNQINILKELLIEEADILEPADVGGLLPDADAVLFPQLVGEAYKEIEKIKRIEIPVIIATSEFGTVAMWDWEIVTFLKSHGLKIFAPYNLELTKSVCRAIALKKEMKNTKFLVFQDDPGEGMQASIFKRFYWWEDECTERIKERFGISIIKKSFKKLGDDAKKISDKQAQEILRYWQFKTEGVSSKALGNAMKMYIALKNEIGSDQSIKGVGMNCLNESFYANTTPCLAWSMLYEEMGLLWVCEGDTLSLLTKYIMNKTIKAPVMMTNIYPYLVGMAALKHEKIDRFPEVEAPENCMLGVHCGYFGCLPRPFASEWTLKPKVLEIVDKEAVAIDGRMPAGDITLAKLHPLLNKIQFMEGRIEEYVQYPGSDCRNGAVIRVNNGYAMMDELYSHHNCIMTGHNGVGVKYVSRVLDIDAEHV